MPKTRVQKEQELEALTNTFKDNKAIILTEFTGLLMDELEEFRNKAREFGVRFRIVKNTLLTKAAKDSGIDLDISKVGKQIAIANSEDDEVAVSKVIHEFTKSSDDRVKIFSGIIENEIVPVDTIVMLASLPSREELLARFVGSINAPVSGFARVLNGPLQGFYNVINALKETKQ
ncbi:MAG: 50S ribosomal protein L10 [Patescibacteria group bacterium]|nr:50S ribosomal protein L10 [Patescibacteria group bacterium]